MDTQVRRKGILLCAVLLAAMFLGPVPAGASLIESSDVLIGSSPYRAFQDTTTNLVWLDLDNFFSDATLTYNGIVALLSGSGFHLASSVELLALQASMPAVPANFAAEVRIVGGNYSGSPYATGLRELMAGIYEDGNSADGEPMAWRWGTSTAWADDNPVVFADTTLRSINSTTQDLGAWVVQDAATVPEPGTVALLGLGLAGLAVLRRRHRAAP